MGRIRDIMERNVITVNQSAGTLEAARLLRERNISFLVVLKDGHVVGVVSERDLIRKVVCDDKKASDVALEEIASDSFLRIGPQARIEDAVQKMLNSDVRRLVVMDGGKLAGVVTQTDLAGFLRSKLLIKATIENIESPG